MAVALGLLGAAPNAWAEVSRTGIQQASDATDVTISADVIAEEPCLVVIRVQVADPNGSVASLTAELSGFPVGHDATFVTNATNTAGTFVWHPTAVGEQGSVRFTATTNSGQIVSTFKSVESRVQVHALGTFRWYPTIADLGTYTVTFTATDSEGETASLILPLTVINRPAAAPSPTSSYSRLSPQAPTRGPIVSITGCGNCGGYQGEIDTVNVASTMPYEFFQVLLSVTEPDGESIVSLTADLSGLPDGNNATFFARVGVTARAGGPYAGVAGVPVQFNGSASSGAPLTWDFGDQTLGEEAAPSHTYATPGTYLVKLAATGPSADTHLTLGDCDETYVVIESGLPARAFIADGHRTTPTSSGGQPLCIQIEPVGGSYENTQVDPTTIRMYSDVSSSAPPIAALSGKAMVVADRDRNGIQEIAACFSREDLRNLLDGTQGRQTVPVTIVAELLTGGTLRASLEIRQVVTGNSLAGSVLPNPLRGSGTVAFVTSRPGPIKIQLFDVNGRLVRTLLDQPHAAGGRHAIPIDGRDAHGRRLASGIYLYRVQAVEGVATGRCMILE